MSPYSALLCICLALGVIAAPFDLSPRNPIGDSPTLNASITDINGVDISSSFQLMLFHQPQLVDSGLNNRDIKTRPVNDCRNPTPHFIESHCTHQDAKIHGMQAYSITCADVERVSLPPRKGFCNADEICVNGVTSSSPRAPMGSTRLMASCISQHAFKQIAMGERAPSSLDLEGLAEGLDHMSISVAVSKPDGLTPMEVSAFDMEAGVKPDGTAMQSKKCSECMDLSTDPFAEGVKGLELQTTMLQTGAIAGVLWMAIMSG